MLQRRQREGDVDGDIIEELLNPDMEPKPKSSWWTSTNKYEEERQREKMGCAVR